MSTSRHQRDSCEAASATGHGKRVYELGRDTSGYSKDESREIADGLVGRIRKLERELERSQKRSSQAGKRKDSDPTVPSAAPAPVLVCGLCDICGHPPSSRCALISDGDDIAERLLGPGAAVTRLLPKLSRKPGGRTVALLTYFSLPALTGAFPARARWHHPR